MQLRRLGRIGPPGRRNAPEIARLGGREAEHVPIGDPVRRFVPVRNPVAAGAKDAIERLAGGDELCPRLGGDDGGDQRVDHRVGNPGEILRALGGGRLRGKIGAQRIARRGGKAEALPERHDQSGQLQPL